MSITRKRAGRASWETRVNYNNDLREAARAIGKAEWKHNSNTTKAMIIERTAEGGSKEVITFSQAYGELSMWLNIAFANITEMGFSDMLADEFFAGATLSTKKAEYRLWVKEGGKSARACGCRYDGVWCKSFCDAHFDEQMATSEAEEADEMGCGYFYQAGEIDRHYQDVI